MAVNTELKRRSTLGVLPTANGAIDGFDRRGVWFIYSGIATDLPSLEGFLGLQTVSGKLLLEV